MQEKSERNASFEVYHNQELIKVYPLEVDKITVGRELRSTIHLPHSRVSRQHGVIHFDGKRLRYKDISRAGSIVNGRVVRGDDVEIRHGDNIAIAEYLIVYNLYSTKSDYGKTDALPLEMLKDNSQWEAIVKWPNGRKRAYPLDSQSLMVGSGANDSVVINKSEITGQAFSLLLTQQGVVLNVDASHLVGLNGKRIAKGLYKITGNDLVRYSGLSLRIQETSKSRKMMALVGDSDATVEINRCIVRAATRFKSLPVMILGETGTGKDLVARLIHLLSDRSENNFVAVNCSSITETLAESLLFGHRAGSFTNAVSDHAGYFERAHKGTLFLDEIGDVPSSIQVKLLRAIENQEIMPVGASELVKVDVRIVTGTNKIISDVHARKTAGFRDDLYYRLAGYEIHIPPLRERKADIPDLIHHFHQEMIADNERLAFIKILPNAIEAAKQYDWPGNVRELKHETQKAILFADKFVKRIPEQKTSSVLSPKVAIRAKIRELLKDGKSYEQVMKELDLPRSTFFRLRNNA